MSPAILFVKPKAISATDKRTLKDAGVIVIEVDNVADVKFVQAECIAGELSGGPLLQAAVKALAQHAGDSTRAAFGMEVCQAIVGMEK